MMWALIIIAISTAVTGNLEGGGPDAYQESFANWDKAIHRYVKNDTRKKEAKQLLKETKKSIKHAQKTSSEAIKRYFDVDRRYEATMADYAAAFAGVDKAWLAADELLTDNRYKMKATLTADEWQKCLKYTTKKMAKIRKKVKKGLKEREQERAKQWKKVEENAAKSD